MSTTLILLTILGFKELLATRCRAVLDQRQYFTQFDASSVIGQYKLPGSGTYLFSERLSSTNPECNYRVEVNNGFSNDSLSTGSSTTINFNSDVIFLGQNGTLKINSIKKNVPYKGYDYTVVFSANSLTVHTVCKDEISFDGHHKVIVESGRDSEDELRGLCGNSKLYYNNRSTINIQFKKTGNGINDDCLGKNGNSLTQDGLCPSLVFGLGFLVASKTEKPERICTDATPFELSENYSDIAMGLDLCGHLDLTRNDSVFRLLIENEEAIADVELFTAVETVTTTMLDVCLYDVGRSLETGLDPMEGACDIINTYVNDVLAELVVNMTMWREDGFCAPTCYENEYFDENPTGCEAPCLSEICVMQTTSGCRCKLGYKRSHTNCVPEAECGCMFAGEYVQPGEEVSNDLGIYRCQKDESSGQFEMEKIGDVPQVEQCHQCGSKGN